MPDVSIIIVSWNTKLLLKDCLQSILAETRKYSFEIIVVDNNSPDNSAEMVRVEFPEVCLIANSTNLGFAAANNQGLMVAKGDFLLLLNPDTIIVDKAIDKMLEYAHSLSSQYQNKPLGILTCKLLNGDRTLQRSVEKFYSFFGSLFKNRLFIDLLSKSSYANQIYGLSWNHDREKEIDWAYGAVILFSREVLEKVGLLDEQFFIYAEEIDYYLRVKKAGMRSVFIPQAEIIHFGQSSSRQRRAAMFIQNYKSFYILLKKHYGVSSYHLYRLRAQLYLLLWFIKFSLGKDEESKIQTQVYKETIKWHFSRQGRQF